MNKTCPPILVAVLLVIIASACNPTAPVPLTDTPLPPEASPSPVFPASLGEISGLQVVYPKDGNLWIWSAGQIRQLTTIGNVSSFLLSGDGSKLAFTRHGNNDTHELWVIDIDGGNERLLVSAGELEELGKTSETEEVLQAGSTLMFGPLAWVPGTTSLAFGTSRSVKYDGTIFHFDLNLVDAVTGERRVLHPPGSGGKFLYSPDGSRIALFTQQHIAIVDADGSNRHDVSLEFQTPTFGEAYFFPQPVWSADGRYLLLSLPPEDPLSDPTLPTTLWHIPSDGSPAIRLGATSGSVLPGNEVAFSPDLAHLAYAAIAYGNQSEIHIADFDGTDDRVVQQGGTFYFWSWSPDGQHFISYSHPEPNAWYIGDLEGSSMRMDILPVDIQVEWVNNHSFLHYVRCEDAACKYELRLTSMQGEMLVIDRTLNSAVFDFYTP